MTNDIISYIKENGCKSYEDLEFNEVDSLILSQLCYLKFDETTICEENCSMSLSEALCNYPKSIFLKGIRAPEKNDLFIDVLKESSRFGDIKLGYYVNILEETSEKQFSAITFLLPNTTYYIAFRGTDSTFVGWKEDFNLSFMKSIPSQLSACKYFSIVTKKEKGHYILGGHSKGGNLAVYCAMTAPKELKSHIVAVYNHDGPGFLPETYEQDGYYSIKSIVHKTIPKTAIIGLILEQHDSYSVVESDAFAFMQHDPFSWEVDGTSFKHLEDIDKFSKYTSQTLNIWLQNVDCDTRKLFFDSLYNIIQSTDAKTTTELLANWRINFKQLIAQIKSTDPKVKKLIATTVHELFNASFNETKTLISQKAIFNHQNKPDTANHTNQIKLKKDFKNSEIYKFLVKNQQD